MVFGRMYSSRTLPSAVNEFDSSDWLIRIYHGVDSIIRQESGGLHQSAVAPHIYQDKCQNSVALLTVRISISSSTNVYKCLHLRIWLWVIKSWKTFLKKVQCKQCNSSFLVNKAFFTCMNCKWHIFSNRILHGVHMWSVLFILLIMPCD